LKVKTTEELKSEDVQLLKQDISSINNFVHRVLDSTKSNQIDYNVCIFFYYFLAVLKTVFIFTFSLLCLKLKTVKVYRKAVQLIHAEY
jgi:hypothetical protein